METPQSTNPEQLTMAGATKETVYLADCLQAIREMRGTFGNKDVEVFSLFIEFFKSAILDEQALKKIEKDAINLQRVMAKETPRVSETMKSFRTGFLTVREFYKYLNNTLDLTHEDIIGQAYDIDELPEEQVTLDEVGDTTHVDASPE